MHTYNIYIHIHITGASIDYSSGVLSIITDANADTDPAVNVDLTGRDVLLIGATVTPSDVLTTVTVTLT
jgi:hypothetical protein